jgi:hypothetical protein
MSGQRHFGGVRPRLLLLAVALLALPPATAEEPYLVLMDWQEGRALVGTSSLAMSPLGPAFALDVGSCHRILLLDLLYDPAEIGVDQEGVGEVFLQYDWLVELRRGEEVVSEGRVRAPGYGHGLGAVDEAGNYSVHLSLANGADVSWQARIRAREVFGDLACEPRVVVSEVETNPDGADAGAEWIELVNEGEEVADLSLWTIRATHGAPAELALPSGAQLAPGERLVVTFTDGQFLDNEDELVEVKDAFGRLRDATPALTDAADDARTWQRDGEAWTFAPGTPNG